MPAAPGSRGSENTTDWFRYIATQIGAFFNAVGGVLNIGSNSITTTNYTISEASNQLNIVSAAAVDPTVEVMPTDATGRTAYIEAYSRADKTKAVGMSCSATDAVVYTIGTVNMEIDAASGTLLLTGAPVQLAGPLVLDSNYIFQSAEITADGSAQATAHGLGRTPVIAIAYMTSTVAAATISAVTSSGTTCTVTGTNLLKYRILAM